MSKITVNPKDANGLPLIIKPHTTAKELANNWFETLSDIKEVLGSIPELEFIPADPEDETIARQLNAMAKFFKEGTDADS